MSVAQSIRTLSQRADEVYSVVGKVTEVDQAARTCSVEPLNGDAELLDVRLQAEQSSDVGPVAIPAVGSWVVVTFLSKETAYVAQFSQVEKVLCVVDGATVEFTKKGVSLASDSASFADQVGALLDTLDGLIGTLLQFQLSTNMGPTIAVMPQIVTALQQHKVDFAQVKSKLETMLY